MRWCFLAWLLLLGGLSAVEPRPPVRVGTFNVRLQLESDTVAGNGWAVRAPEVLALLERHAIEVVGLQEALAPQLRDLLASGTWAYVGVGRDDGREAGEFAPILFRPATWEAIDGGTFWLSETPERPSFGWDAQKYRRICTWAVLRHRSHGGLLRVWNVHFDHEAVVARREAALLLRERADPTGPDLRVVLGDFNCTAADEPYRLLAERWTDTRTLSVAPPEGPAGTFQGFVFGSLDGPRIDHLWVPPGTRVLRHQTLADSQDGRYPSDHFPVVVDLAWP